ncbi:MAG: hypothetical protein H6819_11685 [Phycisphaerales bacterium]|nr:hypothetical protein [Phycisphaerales bacterium]MCB9854074.1 hypothetical protein [Phycisphaerales bacterium]MCB9864384.1 hypothetical protein [Phycisphaerales bacterium]
MIRLAANLTSIAALALLGACSQAHGPVFSMQGTSIVWPSAPDSPRIRYIGEIRGEKSLGIAKSGWTKFSEALSGPAPTLEFSTPMSVAVRGGTIYVADPQNAGVFKVTLEPRSITPIATAAGKPLEWPLDVDLSPSALAIVDSKRAAVFLYDLDGRYQRAMGEGQLKRPSAVAWDNGNNRWWVLDSGAHSCVLFDASGNRVGSIGGKGTAPGQFNFPAGIAYRAGIGAIVADSMNFRVQLMNADGSANATFGQKGDAAGDFAMPRDVATDSDGNIYVVDNQFENIQIFDRQQRLLMALGRGGSGPGQFSLPSGITIDDRDRIWVADTYNRRVQVFQYLKEAPR